MLQCTFIINKKLLIGYTMQMFILHLTANRNRINAQSISTKISHCDDV